MSLPPEEFIWYVKLVPQPTVLYVTCTTLKQVLDSVAAVHKPVILSVERIDNATIKVESDDTA